mmetsp:Transcript_6958/g.19663  ORF Transcript_6958/g.19663 Transcript_6958/m.19663 type:complete len:657 (+) Transcript_6958:66-2036(+)
MTLTFRTRPAFGEKCSDQRRTGGPLLANKAAWRGSEGGQVHIETEVVDIDIVKGPRLLTVDGSTSYLPLGDGVKIWKDLDSTEQKVLAYKAARLNAETRRRLPELAREAERRAEADKVAAADRERQKLRKQLADVLLKGSPHEATELRCRMELARAPITWTPISPEMVLGNHERRAPGMIYGLEFPWTAALLEDFGPAWLTSAFRAAGTLHEKNRVTSVTIEQRIKIDAGNNAGKFLFDVTYESPSPDLDTQLFAKVPFAMTPETKMDRISSSVYKQPMDMQEINTYRLLEASFPMKTPKYYYGDISNETSNFILITARIPYAEMGEEVVGKRKLAPGEVEGPYDKCKDALQLRGPPEDYYMLLMVTAARIAGLHKRGKMCSQEVLRASLRGLPADPNNPQAWGVNPSAATNEAPSTMKGRLQQAIRFFSETASVVFPEYVKTDAFKDKFFDNMMTWSAYAAEIQYWLHHDLDYVSLGHNNLNADNAYFWRDEHGKLDCGVIDWGGFGEGPLGHKMWWTFNCADFEQFQRCLPNYIDVFIATYREAGGPQLDGEIFRDHVILSTFGNVSFMVRAVPDCMKMCPAKEWATIQDRHDPRIAGNINGKSTLRTTLHVLNNGLRVLEEMGSDKVLDKFIQEVYVGKWGLTPKSRKVIFGE